MMRLHLNALLIHFARNNRNFLEFSFEFETINSIMHNGWMKIQMYITPVAFEYVGRSKGNWLTKRVTLHSWMELSIG